MSKVKEVKSAEQILKKTIYGCPELGIKEGELFDSSGRSATIDVLHSMEEYADQVASLKSPQWISVNERLPEATEHRFISCLVVVDGMIEAIMGRFNTLTKTFISEHFTTLTSVTHWMPLPEPPKI